MINHAVLKTSKHGSFQVTQLCKSVAICEAKGGDRYNWGNATEKDPAFLVYFGCRKDQLPGYIQEFNTFYRCYWCEVRKPKHLKGFEAEIKIRGMQRYTDAHAHGLDSLVSTQSRLEYLANPNAKSEDLIEYDEYEYYVTGHQPRW